MTDVHLIERACALRATLFTSGRWAWGWRVALLDQIVLDSDLVMFVWFLVDEG